MAALITMIVASFCHHPWHWVYQKKLTNDSSNVCGIEKLEHYHIVKALQTFKWLEKDIKSSPYHENNWLNTFANVTKYTILSNHLDLMRSFWLVLPFICSLLCHSFFSLLRRFFSLSFSFFFYLSLILHPFLNFLYLFFFFCFSLSIFSIFFSFFYLVLVLFSTSFSFSFDREKKWSGTRVDQTDKYTISMMFKHRKREKKYSYSIICHGYEMQTQSFLRFKCASFAAQSML